ncbi:MAG: hypothetical protein HZB10_00950 [Candidatus Yonathbacteria bacterium]|nr:hypothetical protein [Candidatus Yonathbacteria bacterium]
MDTIVPQKKLESGVFLGRLENLHAEELAPQNLIRTMRHDVADVIKKQEESYASIALAEERKEDQARQAAMAAKRAALENAPPVPKRIGRLVIILAVSIVAIIAVLAYIFILPKLTAINIPSLSVPSFGNPPPVEPLSAAHVAQPLAPSLIPAQSEKRFNIAGKTSDQIALAIEAEIGEGVPSGSVKNLFFAESTSTGLAPVSASRLFAFSNIYIPDLLARSIKKQFMAGFYGEANGGASPFLVLKVSNREMGLAGMLEWEPALSGFFDTIFGANIGGSPNTKFRDIIILEKDARMLEVPFKGTVVYAFADPTTIIITVSRTSLETLLTIASKN